MSASVKRTLKRVPSAPRDGTPFMMGCVMRFNPLANEFEEVMRDTRTGKRGWERRGPPPDTAWWCALPPLSWDLPALNWYTIKYRVICRKRTLRDCLASAMAAVWRRLLAGSVRSTASAPGRPKWGAPKGGEQ